ncbi:MAG TPA: hypothetical protein VLY21_06995 [Nitrososphaerales archaeon]|nr:hypothetical protein [Nitrososphaerales archaeon]
METQKPARPADPIRPVRQMTVANLILLSVQAWTGDSVNLFATFQSGSVRSLGQVLQSLLSAGPGPVAAWNAIEGAMVFML